MPWPKCYYVHRAVEFEERQASLSSSTWPSPHWNQISPISRPSPNFRPDNFLEPLERVWYYRDRECHLAVDKIYSLRNCWRFHPLNLVVDCTQPVESVYTGFASNIILETFRLDILGACGYERNYTSLPSWVPDWTLSATVRPHRILTPTTFSELEPYLVLDSNKGGPLIRPQLCVNNRLVLPGFVMRQVSHVTTDSEMVREPGSNKSEAQEGDHMWRVIQRCLRKWTEDRKTDLTETLIQRENVREALYRTLIANRNERNRRVTALPAWRTPPDRCQSPAELVGDPPLSKVKAYLETFHLTMARRKFFLTQEGDMGVGLYQMQAGDQVCLFRGGPVPYIMRQKPNTGQYELVGECYCHTLMEGARVANMKVTRFEIV